MFSSELSLSLFFVDTELPKGSVAGSEQGWLLCPYRHHSSYWGVSRACELKPEEAPGQWG